MKHVITGVEAGSCSGRLGIRPGDKLISINGHDIIDIIDYEFFSAERKISLVTERDGVQAEHVLVKGEYEPLGLDFGKPLMSGIRSCANRCIFCFEDQNPPGARKTLSSRDDDWRLSLMTGSFITMTNLTDRELDRIIERRASPLYISVHTTDPDLRSRLLSNPRAGLIMDQLTKLAENGISFHTQAVICPGINDGEALEKTIHDLCALFPRALSMAVVPVGLTCHREGCYPLRPFDREEARKVIGICEKWRSICAGYCKDPFVYPADEFYLIAGMELPKAGEYGDYSQIENGVGMLRLLEEEFVSCYEAEYPVIPVLPAPKRKVLIVTGLAAGPFITALMEKHPVPGTKVEVRQLVNRYFGETVNVAGLLTGRELKDKENKLAESDADEIWITETMLREGDDVFLDDSTVGEVSAELGKKIRVIPRGGEALFDALAEAGAE